jgi:hypothetical protein
MKGACGGPAEKESWPRTEVGSVVEDADDCLDVSDFVASDCSMKKGALELAVEAEAAA